MRRPTAFSWIRTCFATLTFPVKVNMYASSFMSSRILIFLFCKSNMPWCIWQTILFHRCISPLSITVSSLFTPSISQYDYCTIVLYANLSVYNILCGIAQTFHPKLLIIQVRKQYKQVCYHRTFFFKYAFSQDVSLDNLLQFLLSNLH